MAKVKITGAFKGTENLNVDIEVYRPNPDGYSFRSAYNKDFVKTFDDMIPGRLYFVDLTGHAIDGSFTIKITGDIEAEVEKTYKDFFIASVKFKIKKPL